MKHVSKTALDGSQLPKSERSQVGGSAPEGGGNCWPRHHSPLSDVLSQRCVRRPVSGWWVATWCVTGWQLIQAEREREWRECRCPACVQPTLRNHHSPPGLPRRLPATQRAETVRVRPRGAGISGLLHQSEQSSQHDLSWKILSKPSRTKAGVEMV